MNKRNIILFMLLFIVTIPVNANELNHTDLLNKSNYDLKKVDLFMEDIVYLNYCVNYFYDGIIDINNEECYYDVPYGSIIDTFIDKPKDGYILDFYVPITLVSNEENYMNINYRSLKEGEIIPPNTGIE